MSKKILIGLAIMLVIAGCVKFEDGAGSSAAKASARGWGSEHGFPTMEELSQYWDNMGHMDSSSTFFIEQALEKALAISMFNHIMEGVNIDCAKTVQPGGSVEACEEMMSGLFEDEETREVMLSFPTPGGQPIRELMTNPSISLCDGDSDCIEMVAMLKNDHDVCYQADDYDECVFAVSLYHNDPSFCDVGPDNDEEKVECLKLFNLDGSLDSQIAALEG